LVRRQEPVEEGRYEGSGVRVQGSGFRVRGSGVKVRFVYCRSAMPMEDWEESGIRANPPNTRNKNLPWAGRLVSSPVARKRRWQTR
jgi:hypothetical protein